MTAVRRCGDAVKGIQNEKRKQPRFLHLMIMYGITCMHSHNTPWKSLSLSLDNTSHTQTRDILEVIENI